VQVQRRPDWTLAYVGLEPVRPDVTLEPQDVWHIKGPSWCAYQGLDSVNLARNAIGLSMATEESQAKFHQNGAKPSGVYSIDGTLNAEAVRADRRVA
jgi:phage portal protein BeeE